MITLSDRAKALAELQKSLESIEAMQLNIGSKIAELLFDQVRLAEKCKVTLETMDKVMKCSDS